MPVLDKLSKLQLISRPKHEKELALARSRNAFKRLSLAKKGQVATITLLPHGKVADPETVVTPREMASALEQLREDHSIRVIVLTGSGNTFMVPPPRDFYKKKAGSGEFETLNRMWEETTGAARYLMAMAEIEKPIVAKVNGDAIGLGSSFVFGSDFIIAREDAKFMDHHMGGTFIADYMGQAKEGGHDFSIVPGDGGAALVPMHLSPCKAKEYLMLAQPVTAAELARLGVINYAVPAVELDAKVDEIVGRLLQRGAYALAWTKRVINRRLMQHLVLTMDAAAAYERINFLHLDRQKGVEKKTLG